MSWQKTISSAEAERYSWGENCDGWHLVRTPELSVIQERMPPGTNEVCHLHERTHQFFFAFAGEAVLEIDGREYRLHARQGCEVASGFAHQIFNNSAADLDFPVISQPPSHGDRIFAPKA